MIKVKNKHKSKPEPNDIYIGRGSVLGNPFTHLDLKGTKAEYHCESREEAINRYEEYIFEKIKNKDPKICHELNKIYSTALFRDVNLICFCHPKSCHGDIIKKIIDQKLNENNLKNLF
jgi:hypothetical protein